MLLYRIISAAVLISLVCLAIIFDRVYVSVVTILIALGLYEFFAMVERKGISIYKYFGIAIGIAIPLSIYFKFELTKSWELLFTVLALIILIILQLTRKDHSQAVQGISVTLFGIIYVAWFFSFLIKLRYLPDGGNLVAGILLITKGSDIGAYLVGVRWGRVPLIARISPKKSVEGALGGLIFSILCGMASRIFIPFSYLHLAIMGASFGVIAQLGDLSESLFKRDCQVKDSGRLIPGMGGVLDVIDSLLFTVPVFYFYMSVIMKQ